MRLLRRIGSEPHLGGSSDEDGEGGDDGDDDAGGLGVGGWNNDSQYSGSVRSFGSTDVDAPALYVATGVVRRVCALCVFPFLFCGGSPFAFRSLSFWLLAPQRASRTAHLRVGRGRCTGSKATVGVVWCGGGVQRVVTVLVPAS